MENFIFCAVINLKSLPLQSWYSKLGMLNKISQKRTSALSSSANANTKIAKYSTVSYNNTSFLNFNCNCFCNCFFPSVILERKKQDPNLRNSESFGIFKNNFQKHSVMFSHLQSYWKTWRHIQACSSIIEVYGAIMRHIQNSA